MFFYLYNHIGYFYGLCIIENDNETNLWRTYSPETCLYLYIYFGWLRANQNKWKFIWTLKCLSELWWPIVVLSSCSLRILSWVEGYRQRDQGCPSWSHHVLAKVTIMFSPIFKISFLSHSPFSFFFSFSLHLFLYIK